MKNSHDSIWNRTRDLPVCSVANTDYTIIYNIYVNTQLFLFLIQLYFVRGDMFRLFIQPSSGQFTIERYLIILRPIWDPTLFTYNVYN